MNIQELIESKNIAEKLDEEKLIKIGDDVVNGYNKDEQSREGWLKNIDLYLKQALQVVEKKTFPWPNASNIKLPLISVAAMQFAARAYPSLVPADGKVVRVKTIGSDPQGMKAERAYRIATHMSYQLMHESDEWETDMDRLLVILPIVGLAYKKTYWDSAKKKNRSCLVHPFNLVVNYWASSLEDAERITQIYYFSERQVVSKKKQGWYLDIDLGTPNQGALSDVEDVRKDTSQPGLDETTPYKILEQHTYLDLDNDGLREPYVVTVDFSTRKVLRIAASYVPENVITNEDGKVIEIEPIRYFTKFPCIPNPDGSFYDIGFGHLLGSINDSANTIVNQLVDSGTLNNLQSGFIGKSLRIKMSDTKFVPGEWKSVNSTADDIKKGVFPLPTKEPSNVLFQLLGMLIQQSKELASVAEIFVGKMPGQNTPAYTTKETVEQGMKLFTAIYKRIYNSLTKEFRKLYKLNKVYLDPQQEISVIDMTIEQSDYEGPEDDVIPAADPMASSKTEKEQKAMALMQIMQIGTLNPMEVTKRILEAMEEPNIEALLMQPQPSPEQQKMQQEMQMKQQDSQMKQQESAAKLEIEKLKAQLDAQKQMMTMQFEKQKYEIQLQFEQLKMALDQKKAMNEHMFKMQEMQDNAAMNRVSNAQKIQQNDEAHKQKMSQQKEMSKQNEKARPGSVAK